MQHSFPIMINLAGARLASNFKNGFHADSTEAPVKPGPPDGSAMVAVLPVT